MKAVKSYTLTLLLCCTAVLSALTGCRKELCYDHETHGYNVTAHVIPEWELEWRRDYGFRADMEDMLEDIYHPSSTKGLLDGIEPVPGAGIASVSYHESGVVSRRHIDSDGGLLHLIEGMHDILFYNNDTEYILFDGLDSYAEAAASTRTRTRASFSAMFKDETTVNSPDMLYGAYVEGYEGVLSKEADSLEIWMRPLVYTYLIVYHFNEGIEYVRSARGSLSGMAAQVYLRDGRTGDEAATILFDGCEVDTANRTVIARVRSFGIPGYSYGQSLSSLDIPDSGAFTAGIEVMLPNGNVWTQYHDITRMMRFQPRGGIIIISGLSISSDEASGGSGGFDVDVGDWEDPDIIDLPLS